MKAEETQVVVMALAHLAVERPGWYEMLRGLAADLEQQDAIQFDRFYGLHRAKAPAEENDSILQLRKAVESQNPLLWAMVSELAWPK